MEGLRRVREGRVEGLGVVEDLEREVGVVLAGDEGGEVERSEAARPRVDWGPDGERWGRKRRGRNAVCGDGGGDGGGKWVALPPGYAGQCGLEH